MVKNLPANAGDAGDLDSILGSGRSSEVGNGNPLQYSCLGNPMDRGAWWVDDGRDSSEISPGLLQRSTPSKVGNLQENKFSISQI